jgi:hypothetical protein
MCTEGVEVKLHAFLISALDRDLRRAVQRGGKVEGELGSSVCIVSGCGLDDRAIEVRSPAQVKRFFL